MVLTLNDNRCEGTLLSLPESTDLGLFKTWKSGNLNQMNAAIHFNFSTSDPTIAGIG